MIGPPCEKTNVIGRPRDSAAYEEAGAVLLKSMHISPDPRTSRMLHIAYEEIRKDRYYFRRGKHGKKGSLDQALSACKLDDIPHRPSVTTNRGEEGRAVHAHHQN